MKFLLTSAGLSNKSIVKAFFDLVGKPANEISIAFIPTAANVEMDDKDWLIKDYANLNGMGFSQIDIVDISALPQSLWQPRLEKADVLFFGGGNTFHLMFWIEKSGLRELLPELLENRVWVGISAGSMVSGLSIASENDRLFAEEIGEATGTDGLGLVNFSLKPHYHSPFFPGVTDENLALAADELDTKLYAIDDNTAISVSGDSLEVISEGQWKEFS
jgi:dipeptidase E